jgi:hypothetical protein
MRVSERSSASLGTFAAHAQHVCSVAEGAAPLNANGANLGNGSDERVRTTRSGLCLVTGSDQNGAPECK